MDILMIHVPGSLALVPGFLAHVPDTRNIRTPLQYWVYGDVPDVTGYPARIREHIRPQSTRARILARIRINTRNTRNTRNIPVIARLSDVTGIRNIKNEPGTLSAAPVEIKRGPLIARRLGKPRLTSPAIASALAAPSNFPIDAVAGAGPFIVDLPPPLAPHLTVAESKLQGGGEDGMGTALDHQTITPKDKQHGE
jgi:hypothetical protein